MTGFDAVWQRIVALQGEMFRQKTGKPFRYRVSGNSLVPNTMSRMLPRSHFARAFDRAPLGGPGQLQDLQGPSYLFAILTDVRVTGDVLVAGPAKTIPHASWDNDARGVTAYATASGSVPGLVKPAGNLPKLPASSFLRQADPRQVLLVIACSAAKAHGGRSPRLDGKEEAGWPDALREARVPVLARAATDTSELLPAWQRYQGGFYRSAGPALPEATVAGKVVIISGGYGVAHAQEPIGWYDKRLRLADWPPGLLEAALLGRARRTGADTAVAFVSQTGPYAQLLRRTPWQSSGLRACLVTITGITDGAMAEVPRRLGLAFAAFWNQQHDSYPHGTAVEHLS